MSPVITVEVEVAVPLNASVPLVAVVGYPDIELLITTPVKSDAVGFVHDNDTSPFPPVEITPETGPGGVVSALPTGVFEVLVVVE